MGSTYGGISELKAFDNTKAGVKGLVDAGVTKIPRIFIHDQRHKLDDKPICCDANIKIPIIDFEGINEDASLRAEIIVKVKSACENWGLFQVVNHGIPGSILNQVVEGTRRFHEQDVEIKKQCYSRDLSKLVRYYSNHNLSEAASWRDTLSCVMGPQFSSPGDLPAACREILITYNNEVLKLGVTLFDLLSEALGLVPNYLKDHMGCTEGISLQCHYYPPCPEPDLTMGTKTHADSGFITVLLQDQIGGLQVFHQNEWFDVDPIPGGLVVNIGSLLQLLTNDKFISVYHRVLARKEGPRISVASAFMPYSSRRFGPIKELLSEKTPPLYREITFKEIISQRQTKSTEETSILEPFLLRDPR